MTRKLKRLSEDGKVIHAHGSAGIMANFTSYHSHPIKSKVGSQCNPHHIFTEVSSQKLKRKNLKSHGNKGPRTIQTILGNQRMAGRYPHSRSSYTAQLDQLCYFCCQLDTTQSNLGRVSLNWEDAPSWWPVGKPLGHLLNVVGVSRPLRVVPPLGRWSSGAWESKMGK